ncbi:unnamed protein product [Boreogadus saida]
MDAVVRPETSSLPPAEPREVRRCGTEEERDAWRAREDVDPVRTLEGLEAARCGLAELCYRRRRQKLRVRHALTLRSDAGPLTPVSSREAENRVTGSHRGVSPGMEEQLVQNLGCLLTRDAGLIGQLKELDHQMNDLRLDGEESRDQETGSRASSGFYELSDAVSGSLSNSSNSVFSESLSSCPSSNFDSAHYHTIGSAHYHTVGSSHYHTVGFSLYHNVGSSQFHTVGSSHCLLHGPPPLSDEGEVTPLFSGTFRPPSVAPSSLQSPIPPPDPPAPPPDPDPGPQPPGPRGSAGLTGPPPPVAADRHARLDGYISALLQRRAPPPRPSRPPRPGRPRTSITTDPSQGALRGGPLGVCSEAGTRIRNTNRPPPPTAAPLRGGPGGPGGPGEGSGPFPYVSAPRNRESSLGHPTGRSRLAPPRKNHKPRPSRPTDRLALGPSSFNPPPEGTGHMTNAPVQAGSKHGRTGGALGRVPGEHTGPPMFSLRPSFWTNTPRHPEPPGATGVTTTPTPTTTTTTAMRAGPWLHPRPPTSSRRPRGAQTGVGGVERTPAR